VYVAGAASGPKDIPDSILSAGAAASEVAGYLSKNKEQRLKNKDVKAKEFNLVN
jgi:heterodisulfide reductase subunit A-like polyferredoxin